MGAVAGFKAQGIERRVFSILEVSDAPQKQAGVRVISHCLKAHDVDQGEQAIATWQKSKKQLERSGIGD